MRRRLLIGALAATLATFAATAAWGLANPQLLSATSQRQHLVVVARFLALAPGEVRVASRPTTDASGALLAANVRLSTRFAGVQAANGTKRWRSTHKLARGVYWVQVSGVETDGVTDCPPKLRSCALRWSNVIRVRIR
jgi:hypothetical protein